MIAVEISAPGGPEVLKPVERPVPHPAAGEVLIRVVAAGVNRPDVMQRRGVYPPPPGASDIPGLEVSGEIETTGDGVTEWRGGDRVCALVAGRSGGDDSGGAAARRRPTPQREGTGV